jgi:hypothetical protein
MIQKVCALLIIVALSASILMSVLPAQAVNQPTIPEFTTKYIDNSYYVNANISVNQNTGKPTLVKAGYQVENNSVELVIKNQPFTSHYSKNGSFVGLYYDIRYKGHLESNWHQVKEDAIGWNDYILCLPLYLPSSNSEYTIDSFSVRNHYLSYAEQTRYENTVGNDPILNFTSGDQVDFQVMALIGYYTQFSDGITSFGEGHHYIFTGVKSEWSNTQTITIGKNTTAVTSTPQDLSEIVSQFSWEQNVIAVVAVVIAASAVVLVLSRRKKL